MVLVEKNIIILTICAGQAVVIGSIYCQEPVKDPRRSSVSELPHCDLHDDGIRCGCTGRLDELILYNEKLRFADWKWDRG